MFSLTPLVVPLPEYTGPHRVGVLDVEVEVERRVVGEAILRATGERAFEVCSASIYIHSHSLVGLNPVAILIDHPSPISQKRFS